MSLIVIDSPGGKEEAKNVALFTGAALDRAGVMFGFHTDDSITDSRLFMRSAALAVRAGLSREKALYGVTMANARILDLDSRVGSLELGKDADFILLPGDPLSAYTHVLQTWIEARKCSIAVTRRIASTQPVARGPATISRLLGSTATARRFDR